MDWLSKYWWILVLVFLVGVLLNVIKDLKRVDHKKFLANKPDLPPHRDFNDKWDDEEGAEEVIALFPLSLKRGGHLT